MTPRTAFLLVVTIALALESSAQDRKIKPKKEEPDPVTQSLPVLKDPPGAATGETSHLVFHVSPLTSKGLLSQQVHEALKSITQENHGANIIKLRAFVAGSGDLRRVQTLVSEFFTDRKSNIPALSTIQVGALPMEGAQVVIESIGVDKRPVNPNGLAFFAGQQTKDVNLSIAQLRTAADSARVNAPAVLRVTCFLDDLDHLAAATAAVKSAFPAAAANFVQQQRLAIDPVVECEAVARLDKSPGASVQFVNPPALTQNPNYSQIALVGASQVVFSGTQMAFGDQEKDIRLAFDRLRKALDAEHADYKSVFWSGVYPLTKGTADRFRSVRFDYLDHARPPASTLLLFEGLPSLDASVAFEVAAALN